ncbi:hypothetical protein ACFQL0_18095 [Haloplanus litoreus]|uniref:hypothetical protein n=1 Tax=Haloplanus litoreus TaxID=767515 RepID=UPI00360DEE8C
MSTKRTGAILMAAVLLVSAVAPATVAAQSESLSIDVTQDDETGTATISVASNGTAVENATVNVTVTENETYSGTGTCETDGNGTVSLPEPDESVTVTVEATADGANASTTVTLEPVLDVSVEEGDDGSAVVTVMRGNATVENATVNVTVTENETRGYRGVRDRRERDGVATGTGRVGDSSHRGDGRR